ncbi:MAG: SIR2 family protein, partial [Nitratireductor sp.]
MHSLNWHLVGDALKAGRYNLLLGAGVSLDSQSGFHGENCPSAGALANALQDALPGVRKGSSINRLYRSMAPEQVEALITKRFVGCTPGDTVRAIAGFRWKRVFTLNVDDALEQAYETRPLPVQLYRTFNHVSVYESVRDLRVLPIVHLHGWAREPEHGYIFDISEYATSIARNSIWAHVLTELIRTEPFIVLGTSLEEPDLVFFMSQRGEVHPRRDAPPSILVEPFPDEATEKDCDAFKMTLFEGTALNFLTEVDSLFPVRPSVTEAIEENLGDISRLAVEPVCLAEFHADFERVPTETLIGTDGGINFAYGHQATWLDIQNGRDIARRETETLQAGIVNATPSTIILIDGGPGAGKSATLKRVAWNLAQSGRICLWLKSIGRIRIASAAAVLKAIPGRRYVFVDNFADNVVEVVELRERLKGEDILFVGAERSYRLSHVERVVGTGVTQVTTLGSIGQELMSDLIRAYTSYGLAAPPKVDRFRFPLENELIAIACCRVLNNFEPLTTIIDRSVRDAPRDVDCYVFAALAAHCYRQGIEYDVINSRFLDYQVDIQIEDDGPLPLKLETVSTTEFVTPLNEAVSDTILKRFAAQEPVRMLATFTNLALAIRPRVNLTAIVSGEPCARIAARLFDYDEIVRTLLGVSGAGEFYDSAKPVWEWNSRYWQQRAQHQLDLANASDDLDARRRYTEVAVQHARFAQNIEPEHQFTMTTIGRTLFGKMRVLGHVGAADLAEAIDALSRAIAIERQKRRMTVHPFIVLFR